MVSLKNFLNSTTMYRLALYVLFFLIGVSVLLSILGVVGFKAEEIILQTALLLFLCYLFNRLLSVFFGATVNKESALITALILALIVGPVDMSRNLFFLTTVAFIAMVSKYAFAVKKRHIFNPAAFAVVASAIFLNQGASWWVGSMPILPFALIGGVLILYKIKRFMMVSAFLIVYLFLSFILGANPVNVVLYTPIIFFVTIMFTEPLTSPHETKKQIAYALVVGVILILFQQFFKVSYTLELALLTGNLFAYLVVRPFRIVLKLVEKKKLAQNTYAFYFEPEFSFDFKPGQFMHWTLPHPKSDKRGVRRSFTICSSPTDENVAVAVKIPGEASSFKSALKNMKKGGETVAMDVSGEFVLPKDEDTALVFIAGGIGITPFISMIRWMISRNEKRDIVLLYSNSTKEDIAFKDVLKKAQKYGVKTHFVVTKRDGYIDENTIKEKVSNWKDRTYYISGPQPMVEIFKNMLAKMKVEKIKTDFFPGYTETHQK